MKNKLTKTTFISFVSCLILLSGCTPDEIIHRPELGSTEVGIVTEATATCISLITSDGGNTIIARGVCWSTSPEPTIENDTTSDAYGTGAYSSTLTNLNPNTTYYVRAYATNKGGITYGVQVTFTTKTFSLTTLPATGIHALSATCGGVVSSNGDSLTITERGVCWSTNNNPTIELETKTADKTRVDSFYYTLTDLLPNTTYYARAYATNSLGTTYGDEISFTTRQGVANITTHEATAIIKTMAYFGGTITDDGGDSITERGLCWSTNINPTVDLTTKTVNGSGLGTFTGKLTGLTADTRYYIRAYATNSIGTTYGDNISFSTLGSTGTVTDIDGNVYHFVTIGTQTWMVENLNTTRYCDGTPIPNVTDNTQWCKQKTGAYCDYNNTPSNSTTYGRLYNLYAVRDSRKLAPLGWHVPNNNEWGILTGYLNGGIYVANKLKEAGTAHWATDSGASNSSGFTALPGGHRNPSDGVYRYITNFGCWWENVISLDSTSVIYELRDNLNYVSSKNYIPLNSGYSVRCLMD